MVCAERAPAGAAGAPTNTTMAGDDRVEDWDMSKWPTKPWPEGEPIPEEGMELSPEDLLDMNRHRDYVRGQVYAVWVPSPFACANPDAAPVLRYRVCSDPGDLADGGSRDPVFATTAEWAATCGADASRRLVELEQQVAELGGVPECYSVKRAAQFLGLSDKTVYKLICEGELRAFQVGGQHRIPSDALEDLQQRRSAPPTEDENASTAPPMFNPNFRRDATG